MVRGSHEGGDLDGRRDASEERRTMGTSTSRRRILNREGRNGCNYDYIHDQRVKEQRDKEKKRVEK